MSNYADVHSKTKQTYSEFPSEFAKEKNNAINSITKDRNTKYANAKTDIENKYSRLKKKTKSDLIYEIDDNYVGYLKFFTIYKYVKTIFVTAIIMAILGFIVGMYSAITETYIMFEGEPVSEVIFFTLIPAIGSGICMAIYRPMIMAILCIVLTPILFPLFKLFYSIHENGINNARIKLDNLVNKELQEITNQLDKTTSDKIERIQNEINAYQSGFESEAKHLAERFVQNPHALAIGEWIADKFLYQIKRLKRDQHIENLESEIEWVVTKTGVKCKSDEYNFEEKRCARLATDIEQTALTFAVVAVISAVILDKYPKDSSGSNYVISAKYLYPTTKKTPAIKVTSKYIAHNDNFIPLESW